MNCRDCGVPLPAPRGAARPPIRDRARPAWSLARLGDAAQKARGREQPGPDRLLVRGPVNERLLGLLLLGLLLLGRLLRWRND
jgi:hypothetical protein